MKKNQLLLITLIISILTISCKNNSEKTKHVNYFTDYTDTVFYNNGTLQSITHYSDNLKHGKETFFNENGKMIEYYYYINGIKEGDAYIKDSISRTIHDCVFDQGYKVISGMYLKDNDINKNFVRYYNHYNEPIDTTVWVGDLYYDSNSIPKSSYYYNIGGLYDTIQTNDEYALNILTFKNKYEKDVGLKLYTIFDNDTLASIDTLIRGESEIVEIPIKNYKIGINKISGGIAYKGKTESANVAFHQMKFYKWLIVEKTIDD